MKQIFQNQRNGQTDVTEVPCPQVKSGHLLIRNVVTLISSGTEKTVVDFGRAGFLEKARKNPEKVKMVLEKLRTEGIRNTIETVASKLDQPIALGYCSSGVVLDVGKGVSEFSVGDRVASNGKHAEVVLVPVHLCTRIDPRVDDEQAAFTVIGAIGLQGLRLAQPTLGEAIVVVGLGLVGLVTVQLLIANGCRVLGIDLDAHKLELARNLGAQTANPSTGIDPVQEAIVFSRGRGVDAVIITAATSSNEPIHNAALMSRKRGRIILVGVTGLELSREDFYEKELSFQVSCSYGPGRYDPFYEEGGHDYPVGFVRWTEQRNLEAMMDMLASGRVDVRPLISHRFPLEEAPRAYELLAENAPYLGILLNYPAQLEKPDAELRLQTTSLPHIRTAPGVAGSQPSVSFIGAGDHATRVLIPAFKKCGVRLKRIATTTGVGTVQVGNRYGFVEATTDTGQLISDPEIDVVVVATRHNSHADFTIRALGEGKHVFVEKPLALTYEELNEIEAMYSGEIDNRALPILTVGFNRRFAPQIIKTKTLLEGVGEPRCMVMTVNAGFIPDDSWIQDPITGGGRIIGEACHFIDLLRYLAGHPIESFQASMVGRTETQAVRSDKSTITLVFSDGSLGTIHYFANGHKSFPKERLEIFCAGRILQLDNFQKLRGYGWPGFNKSNLWKQDKGHEELVKVFVKAVKGEALPPIPIDEILEVTLVSIKVNEMLVGNCPEKQ